MILTVLLVALMIKTIRLDAKSSITIKELEERYYTKIAVIIGHILFEYIYLEQTLVVFLYGLLAISWIVKANRDRSLIIMFKNNNNDEK